MSRTEKLVRLAVGLAACTMAAFALLAPGIAAAASGGGPVGLAATVSTPKSVTSQYSCNLSGYGSGLQPIALSGTLAFPASVPAQSPLAITLSTTSATLPSAVLSQLHGVTAVSLAATVTAQHASAPSVTLHGQVSAPAQLTGLSANAATGNVTFPAEGTGVIEAPAKTLTLVPLKGATALPSISCTTTAATQNVSVTVDPPMTGSSGPLYTCKVTMGTVTATVIAAIPMTITDSGSRTTGKTDTVTLASAALGAPYPQGTTSVSFAGDLPVNGAQSGKTALAKTTTDVTSATFRVSGNLLLTKPGTTHILVPEKFTFTDSMKASPTAAVVTMTLACTIKTSPTPVGLTAHVTGAPINPASSSGSGSASGGGQGGQAEGTGIPLGVSVPASGGSGTSGSGTSGSGTPVGAPNTGGGTGPASNPALAVAGLALVLAGGGLVFLASQRRRRQAG
jgi:LPXTG-motif cell wall-anchored protein